MEVNSSIRDELVLNAIFNPHTPLEDINTPEDIVHKDNDNDKVAAEMKALEIDAVNSAQKGDLEESLNLFNELVVHCPNYPSGYNNRAQLYRLQGKFCLFVCFQSVFSLIFLP